MKKGISLAVLVVTIIVLVILTAATIATITGENGVIDEARIAVNDSKQAQAKEYVEMEMSAIQIKAARAKQNVYEYLTDATYGSARKATLVNKGISVNLEETDKIKCLYDNYEIISDINGNIIADNQLTTGEDNNSNKISLDEAREMLDTCIETPETTKVTIAKLSTTNQIQFTADIIKAINEMPGSIEEKTAKFLNVTKACLRGASMSNRKYILAEIYATTPPESLTVLCERFAIDIMNRDADPSKTFTDEQFTMFARDLMNVCVERCEETDNGSVRATFLILTLVRASNDSISDLAERLINCLKYEDDRELAREEWIPSALGKDGREAGYEPLLASADAGRRPDLAQVLIIAGPQHLESLFF